MRKVTPLLLALILGVAATAHASNSVRISQVYGGGGGYYKCDYVELFNNSSASVDIGGWSVQYASATGASFGSATYNYALIPSGATIPACGYYLIKGYCHSTTGAELPVTPDLAPSSPATWVFNLATPAGKVALFSDQVTSRNCATAQSSGKLVDLVGYGSANCYEGAAAAPALDVSSVLVRASAGAVDTDNNSADFSKQAEPWPMHNSASATNPECGQGSAPPAAPTLVVPLDEATGVTVPSTLTVEVSDPDADALTVQFYGRAVPPPPPGACCTPGDGCVFVTEAECAAQSGAFKGAGVPCESGACVPLSGDQCELILLPDTQEYTTLENGGTVAMFQAQTQWIVSNRVSRNIVAVAHEGDITDKFSAVEYDRSLTAMTLLENPVTTGLFDGIPYSMLMGNHDDDNVTLFNQYYGVSRFAGRGYYGGRYDPNTNDNSYILFSGAGRDFVLVSLSFGPSPAVLTWAKGVLEANPGRLGIVVSHSILNEGDSQTSWTPEGQAIYDGLKGTPNLILMACGHMSNFAGEGRRTDVYGGYTIHSLLADYQDRGDGGGGRLRILQFVPAENKVRVRTYSPFTDVWEADADSSSQFTLDVDLGGGTPQRQAQMQRAEATLADFALLGTVAGVTSGSTASLDWGGLDPLTQYEWYAIVSDLHTGPVTGPTWVFTTADNTAGVAAGEAFRGFALSRPQPNPTTGVTRLDFAVPRDSRVSLGLYDMQGRRVATLAEGLLTAGRHQAVWNGTIGAHSAPTGIYFLRLQAEGVNLSQKLVVTR